MQQNPVFFSSLLFNALLQLASKVLMLLSCAAVIAASCSFGACVIAAFANSDLKLVGSVGWSLIIFF
jgi:hypothetical protein